MIGEQLSLVGYGGEILLRTVVALEKSVLYVCKREEFEAAQREEREPTCIGFRLEDLVKGVN